MNMLKSKFCLLIVVWFTPMSVFSQLSISWKEIGQLKTRSVKDIEASTWSVGGETLDRDFTDFQSYKKYLSPLGAKKIRLQAGWAKCEKTKGVYDFKWLDDIVNGAIEEGVTPWMELAYGNPIYEGGGEARLGGALPYSVEGLNAWDNWVKAIVNRYKDKVIEWEVWNEPDHGKGITPETYALFYIRTAKVIRSVHPKAKLLGVALASLTEIKWVDDFCKVMQRENALELLEVFVYHGYAAAYGWAYNPDDVYPQVDLLRKTVGKYTSKVIFMQGESGAPSTPNPAFGVFKDYNWSEITQCKWNLRRMLGDNGRGIHTSLFAMSDMHYGWGTDAVRVNTKGILKTNPDKTIERPKMAYKVAQQVFSLFDNQIAVNPTQKIQSDRINQSFFGYTHPKTGFSLVSIWQNEHPPYENYPAQNTNITVVEGSFTNPVFVDLITGKIYEIPKNQCKKAGKTTVFEGIPVPDYPVLIADKSILLIK
jgi:hypothetical protein